MLRKGITVFQSQTTIPTSLRSLPHGVGTVTKLVHKGTLRHRTGTPENSTRMSMMFPTKPNASVTNAYGQILSKKLLSNESLATNLRSTRNCAEPEKFEFGSNTVDFAGFVITPTNIKPTGNQTSPRNTRLFYATKHHWHPILVRPY